MSEAKIQWLMTEMIEAEVSQAATDPAPEYLPPYQDPPGIDDPFISE